MSEPTNESYLAAKAARDIAAARIVGSAEGILRAEVLPPSLQATLRQYVEEHARLDAECRRHTLGEWERRGGVVLDPRFCFCGKPGTKLGMRGMLCDGHWETARKPERTDHAYNEWVRAKVEQEYPRRDECDGYADWPHP